MIDAMARAAVWRALGATPAAASELVAYCADGFDRASAGALSQFPLPDEPFADVWREYAADAERDGVAHTLIRRLPQLRFPIASGVSQSEDYVRATRCGIFPADLRADAPTFVDSDGLRLFVHQTPAGAVPVVLAPARADFERLVRALTRRNEPEPIPRSMGACMVAGYNNWDRVARLRAQPGGAPDWMHDKARYQDRFVLLSDGPYSATPAAALGLGDEDWRRISRVIRLEHECAHYFTRRAFGAMSNRVFDELIADSVGLARATGMVRASWILQFLGLERYPHLRPGGRIENYKGTPPLSPGAFTVLQDAVVRAAAAVEGFNATIAADYTDPAAHACVMLAIGTCGFETLVGDDAVDHLTAAYLRSLDRVAVAQLECCDRSEHDNLTPASFSVA